jgi:hypothetical protein
MVAFMALSVPFKWHYGNQAHRVERKSFLLARPATASKRRVAAKVAPTPARGRSNRPGPGVATSSSPPRKPPRFAPGL